MVVMTNRFGQIEVPNRVVDLDSFVEWVHSGELPEKLKVHFIQGQVWIDPMEEYFSHNRVKLAITRAIDTIAEAENLGLYFGDGGLYRNADTGLATIPDAIFVSAQSLASGRVTFATGRTSRTGSATILDGSPDLVVEVVSPSSGEKDYERLMTEYFAAGVTEYWLVDARTDDVELAIHRRTPKGFAAVRKVKGWLKSEVLGRSFRLVQRERFGMVDYVLEVK
jgi:Uma2 family endonuclease